LPFLDFFDSLSIYPGAIKFPEKGEMIPRKILGKLLGELEKLFVSILIGPRQVGKGFS